MSPINDGPRQPVQRVLEVLAQRFGPRLSTAEAVRRQHANALTWLPAEPPDAVLWPETNDEVAAVVRTCAEHRVPVIAFGAGTSLEGHVNAPHGGLSIDLSRMNRVLAVRPRDLDCTIEAGVRRGDLDRHLRDTGLFFPVDPGACDATIGGMAATRASGTTTVRYGSMRDNVVSLTAVMADGCCVRTGGRARKSAAGYDLTHLFVGSEGTLGIITELTLRLHPVPETVVAAVAGFADVAGACNAAIATIQCGLGVARIELMDAVQVAAVNTHAKLGLAVVPTLLVEFHGSLARTRDDADAFRDLAREAGALGVETATGADERRRLWQARHDAFWSIRSGWPGKAALVTDVCVPLSHLADCVAETAEDIRRSGLTAPIVGHVGDGNFHAIVVFDAADCRENMAVRAFVDRLSARALAFDGTCTGEHGIGQGKTAALAREAGSGLALMQAVKSALDPLGILNPGKLF
ncbi:MAG: FAD-binding oxidoreductase [Hyphomicrobium sp.]